MATGANGKFGVNSPPHTPVNSVDQSSRYRAPESANSLWNSTHLNLAKESQGHMKILRPNPAAIRKPPGKTAQQNGHFVSQRLLDRNGREDSHDCAYGARNSFRFNLRRPRLEKRAKRLPPRVEAE